MSIVGQQLENQSWLVVSGTKTEVYQFLSVVDGLWVLFLTLLGLVLPLQEGLDGLVLGIEVTHILQTQGTVIPTYSLTFT